MTAEIRYQTGTRVINARGTIGTVQGYTGTNLSVRTDGGGTSSGPAHFRTWRALTHQLLSLDSEQVLCGAEQGAGPDAVLVGGPVNCPTCLEVAATGSQGCTSPGCIVPAPHGTHGGAHRFIPRGTADDRMTSSAAGEQQVARPSQAAVARARKQVTLADSNRERFAVIALELAAARGWVIDGQYQQTWLRLDAEYRAALATWEQLAAR